MCVLHYLKHGLQKTDGKAHEFCVVETQFAEEADLVSAHPFQQSRLLVHVSALCLVIIFTGSFTGSIAFMKFWKRIIYIHTKNHHFNL